MGFGRSPDCNLDLHQTSASTHTTHDTKYTRSVRLGWDQPDMSVRSMVWLGHGVLKEREREALDGLLHRIVLVHEEAQLAAPFGLPHA